MAARFGRNRGSAPGLLRRRRRCESTTLPGGYAGGRRQLGAEFMAGWPSLLERRPDGRNRFPHLVIGFVATQIGAGPGQTGALVTYGPQGREFHSAQRSGHAAGPLGRGWRIFSIHLG